MVTSDTSLQIGTAGAQFFGLPHQNDPFLIAPDEMTGARCEQNTATGGSGCAKAVHHDPDVLHLLADDLECIRQRGQQHHSRAVLVVVHDGNVKRRFERAFNLETARRTDVLQIDASETGGDAADDANDFFRILGGQADRPGIDAGNSLKSMTLPSITGSAAAGPRLPSPEHGGAIGDDRHTIALDGEGIGFSSDPLRWPGRRGRPRVYKSWRGRCVY